MNDSDIDKLIGDGLKEGTAGEVFRQRVLRESSIALARGRASRIRLRAVGLTLGVILIATGAFICGQLSAPGQVMPEQGDWANVPKELVLWLDAGRFFEQLGMDERAERAYQQANELILHNRKEIMQARTDSTKSLSGVLASLPTHNYSRVVVKWRDSTESTGTAGQTMDWSNKKPSVFEILAQYLGD